MVVMVHVEPDPAWLPRRAAEPAGDDDERDDQGEFKHPAPNRGGENGAPSRLRGPALDLDLARGELGPDFAVSRDHLRVGRVLTLAARKARDFEIEEIRRKTLNAEGGAVARAP